MVHDGEGRGVEGGKRGEREKRGVLDGANCIP